MTLGPERLLARLQYEAFLAIRAAGWDRSEASLEVCTDLADLFHNVPDVLGQGEPADQVLGHLAWDASHSGGRKAEWLREHMEGHGYDLDEWARWGPSDHSKREWERAHRIGQQLPRGFQTGPEDPTSG